MLMPDLGTPEMNTFMLWAGRYTEELVVRGLNRAAGKLRRMKSMSQPMTLDDAVRYAASVMKNESLGVRRHDQRPATITHTSDGSRNERKSE
jgi:hypothetical protein